MVQSLVAIEQTSPADDSRGGGLLRCSGIIRRRDDVRAEPRSGGRLLQGGVLCRMNVGMITVTARNHCASNTPETSPKQPA